jgi:DNA-binding CsgD family transcriptional regulator
VDSDPAVVEALAVASQDELIGRDAELAAASAALCTLGEGRASALVIEGEAGIGKTRLVQSLVDGAVASGMTALYGEAHPFERTRPFGAVATTLGLTRRSPDPRRATLGSLLTGHGADVPAPTGDTHHRVVEMIVDLVESSCAEAPVLLVAEDIHWADAASLMALSSVVRRLPLSPLVVVVTTRPSPVSAEAIRLLDDLAVAGARTLTLEPLTPDDLAALARRELGAAPGPMLIALLDRTGGNPLWATAMLRALDDEDLLQRNDDQVEAITSELPASMSDLVVRRLRHLSTETLELLQITAVLGDAVSLRDVAAVAPRAPTDLIAQLGEAFDAQLLDESGDGVAFRHQLVHDAIYQHVPAPARRVLHREAALALMSAGADPLDVAHHLVLGAERGDEQAVAWLRTAAREASLRAPAVAVELLRRAEALLPGGHPQADLVSAEIVVAMLTAGRVAEASARAEAVLARQHAAEVDTSLRVSLLGALALQNRAAEVIAVAQAGLAGTSGLPPAAEVPMLTHQSWAHTYTGDHRAGEAAARRALSIAEEAGNAALTIGALTALLVAVGRGGRFGEGLAHAQRAATLAAGSHDTRSLSLHPKFFLGLALFDCDRVGEARAAYRAALDDEFGSAWWLSDTLVADAQACFAIGDWDDAVPGLIASGEAAKEKDHPLLLSQSLAYQAIIATAKGDHRNANELLAGVPTLFEDGELPYNAGVVATAWAGLKEAEGDQQGAYDVLLRCWRFESANEDRYYHRSLAADLVRLALALDHRDVASEVADAVSEAAALAAGVPTVDSLALRCRGLVDAAVEPMMEAVALVRDTPLLIEHAGACEDAATVLAEAGQQKEAAALLTEALKRHERAGAEAWASRVRARLRPLGVRPGRRGPRNRPTSGWASLTETERAVSLLVAEGLTNGAVARRLYISPHTVNTHLRHVFSKMGVSNRVALAAVVNRSIE